MHCVGGFAALKSFEDRVQDRASEVHAVGIREENKAIEPEDVQCVRELLQRGIDIRQGKAGETSESVWPFMNELGREFVAAARQSPSFGAISPIHAGITHPYAGTAHTSTTHE